MCHRHAPAPHSKRKGRVESPAPNRKARSFLTGPIYTVTAREGKTEEADGESRTEKGRAARHHSRPQNLNVIFVDLMPG
jgi:hypothetical protein